MHSIDGKIYPYNIPTTASTCTERFRCICICRSFHSLARNARINSAVCSLHTSFLWRHRKLLAKKCRCGVSECVCINDKICVWLFSGRAHIIRWCIRCTTVQSTTLRMYFEINNYYCCCSAINVSMVMVLNGDGDGAVHLKYFMKRLFADAE